MSILRIIFKIVNFLRSVFSECEHVRIVPEIRVIALLARNFRITFVAASRVWKSEYD